MKNFNVRVYGLLINTKNEILVSDERRAGISFTKFPGGGLVFGEGLSEALLEKYSPAKLDPDKFILNNSNIFLVLNAINLSGSNSIRFALIIKS